LKESWFRSWNLRTLWLYVWLLLSGQKSRGSQGKPNQLGGDFIADKDAIVLLAYRIREAADRPDVTKLLALLRKLDERKA